MAGDVGERLAIELAAAAQRLDEALKADRTRVRERRNDRERAERTRLRIADRGNNYANAIHQYIEFFRKATLE